MFLLALSPGESSGDSCLGSHPNPQELQDLPKKTRPEKLETQKSMGLHVFTFDLMCLEVMSGITNPSSETFEHSLKTNFVP